MKREEILKLIYSEHAQMFEKSTVLKDFLSVFNKKGVWTDVEGILFFFNTTIEKHFLKENILIGALVKKPGVSREKVAFMSDIVSQHDVLMKSFRDLTYTAEKLSSESKDLSMEFIAEVNKAVMDLVKHSQSEDSQLFPEAEARLDNDDMLNIEADIITAMEKIK